jgi:hypothetical protein
MRPAALTDLFGHGQGGGDGGGGRLVDEMAVEVAQLVGLAGVQDRPRPAGQFW